MGKLRERDHLEDLGLDGFECGNELQVFIQLASQEVPCSMELVMVLMENAGTRPS